MPFAAAIIPALIGAAVSTGTSIYETVNQPGAPKEAKPTQAQQDASALKTRQTQEQAITQALPGLQTQVGGSLSPEALLRLATVISGQAGGPGIGASIQDLLMKMSKGDLSVSAGSGGGSTTGGLSTSAFG